MYIGWGVDMTPINVGCGPTSKMAAMSTIFDLPCDFDEWPSILVVKSWCKTRKSSYLLFLLFQFRSTTSITASFRSPWRTTFTFDISHLLIRQIWREKFRSVIRTRSISVLFILTGWACCFICIVKLLKYCAKQACWEIYCLFAERSTVCLPNR